MQKPFSFLALRDYRLKSFIERDVVFKISFLHTIAAFFFRLIANFSFILPFYRHDFTVIMQSIKNFCLSLFKTCETFAILELLLGFKQIH